MIKNSRDKIIPLASEGLPYISTAFGVAILFFLLEGHLIAYLTSFLGFFLVYFFRDPNRSYLDDDNIVLSPADGKVVDLREENNEKIGEVITISIFLSIFDVHINRFPVSGELMETEYHPGRYLPAFRSEASKFNEQNYLLIKNKRSAVLIVKQIAGVVARRVVCWAEKGDFLKAGERFGMIKFGSRVDISLPRTVSIKVRIGDRVKGGESILASFNS